MINQMNKIFGKGDDETIATWMLLYGPKADLEGEGCEFEIEDGFVAKGV